MTNKNTMTAQAYKEQMLEKISQLAEKLETDVLRTGSNELSLPFVDDEQNEQWLKIVVSVPTGSRDGTPYDGYEKAEEYQEKEKEKERKRIEREAEKKRKKESDEARRKLMKEKKEKREK